MRKTKSIDWSCKEFVDVLATAAPTPGGGGAAALAGAIGMALGNMVGSLTLGKPKYAAVQEDIVALKAQASALQDRLLALVERDAKVFAPLAKAYGLPTNSQAQKAKKALVMEKCLRECAAVPLEIMAACAQAIDLQAQFAAKGTAIAISDVGCGVVLCCAAMRAASLNVLVNSKSMSDRDYAQEVNQEAKTLLESSIPQAEAIFANVARRFAQS
jgi:formiminotetrahydrofolate cyclodeaminase